VRFKGDDSYTDGDSITIGSNVSKPDQFDSVCGLSLHEASHIKLSDFKVLRDLMKGCHFFDTTFTGDATETAYREGERSVVLRILKILNLNFLKDSTGSSNESSTVIILDLGLISNIKLPSKDVLPDERVPATSKVRAPSIKKLNNPAAKGFTILFLINKGKVQGDSLCLLIEKAKPSGLKGF